MRHSSDEIMLMLINTKANRLDLQADCRSGIFDMVVSKILVATNKYSFGYVHEKSQTRQIKK